MTREWKSNEATSCRRENRTGGRHNFHHQSVSHHSGSCQLLKYCLCVSARMSIHRCTKGRFLPVSINFFFPLELSTETCWHFVKPEENGTAPEIHCHRDIVWGETAGLHAWRSVRFLQRSHIEIVLVLPVQTWRHFVPRSRRLPAVWQRRQAFALIKPTEVGSILRIQHVNYTTKGPRKQLRRWGRHYMKIKSFNKELRLITEQLFDCSFHGFTNKIRIQAHVWRKKIR